ncbi:MAG: trypsin-like peptidase domain-containing protein [Planctomycetota bacterium]
MKAWLFAACIATVSTGSSCDLHAQDAGAVLEAIESSTIAAIDKAEPSVVAIARIPKQARPNSRARFNPLSLDSPMEFDSPISDPDFVPTFYGSGVIISADGFVLTCAHLLGDPEENDYFIWRSGKSFRAKRVSPMPETSSPDSQGRGRSTVAQVQASDAFSDLAVLKIDAANLTPIEFGSTKDLRKGKFVIALGNPDAIARDGTPSASWGIIANLNRIAPSRKEATFGNKETVHEYGTLIQTDAKMNFGSSGGALIDMKGRLIGLTTSLAAQKSVGHAGGYAIAADELFLRVIEELKAGRLPDFGFLGIQPDDLRLSDREKGRRGARVRVVLPGLPADLAGLQTDDIIIEVNGAPIYDRDDLFRELSLPPAGENLRLLVHRYRSGAETPEILPLRAKLGKKPLRSARPSYAIHQRPRWRGLEVDYWTAISTEIQRIGISAPRFPQLKVAVSDIEHGTTVWNAGVRAGYGILKVQGQSVQSPDEFRKAVENLAGPVTLEIIQTDGRKKILTIPVPTESHSESS